MRIVGSRGVNLLIAVGLTATGCKPQTPPPVDYGAKVRAWPAVVHGGDRLLKDLDLSGDGKINAPDWEVLEAIAHAATAQLEKGSLSVDKGLYQGPPKDAPTVFSFVHWKDGKPDLAKVPQERVAELAIEARWAAQQARVATLDKDPLGDDPFHGLLTEHVTGYHPETMEPAAVCKALEHYDVAPLKAAGLPATAIFDLDSTVWGGNVSEAFLAVLVEQKASKEGAGEKLKELLKSVEGVDPAVVDKNSIHENARIMLERANNYDLPKPQRVNAAKAFYNTVGIMAGMTVEDAKKLADQTFEKGTKHYAAWKGKMYHHDDCSMRDAIKILKGKGVDVYFLSATLDLLAAQAGPYFDVPQDRILGSILEVKDGAYTGKVADSTYYTKGAIVRQWLPAPPVFAFGDSPTSDFGMLMEASGAAFMVNARPDFKERDVKEARSWLVEVPFAQMEEELAKDEKNAP